MYSFSNKRDRTQLAVGVSKPYTYILGGDLEKYRLGIPLGKIAEPQEIAEMIYFLSTEKAGHITMEEVTIDGGATMGV